MNYSYKKVIQLFLVLSLTALVCACNKNDRHIRQGYIEGRFTYVSSQVGGTLEGLTVSRGDAVKTGQPLFRLESDPQLSVYNQAKAQLQQSQSQLANLEKGKRPSELAAIEAQQHQVIAQIKFSKITVARYRQLAAKKLLPQEKLDDAVSKYKNQQAQLKELQENLTTAKLKARVDEIKAAEAQVKSAKAALKKATWELQQKTIVAPVTGQVFDTYFRIGEVVAANQAVLSILAPENVYVVFFAPEEQLSQLKTGQTIHFTCDGTKKIFTATISFISPEAEYTPPVVYSEKSRSKLVYRVEAKLSLNDAKILHPGQPITVNLKE